VTSQQQKAPKLDFHVGMETDAGPVRELNEDYVACFQPADQARVAGKGAIFLVADGMGGHQAGEVASQMAAECVMREYYADAEYEPGDSLVRAVKFANQVLYNQAHADESKWGMGTTMVAAVILDQQVHVVNVGDSRAYLINEQGIARITQDHSWVEEQVQAGLLTREQAEQHPQRNLITRALGHDSGVNVDLFKGEIHDGDILLLCSDGLSGPVADQQLAAIALSQPPPEAAEQLIAQAKVQHANDNISVVVVQAVDPANLQADALELAEEDVTPTELTSPPDEGFLISLLSGLQGLIAKIPLSAEKRQWLLVGLAVLVFFCCLCGGLSGFLAISQKFTGDPVTAPQIAPIGPVSLVQDDPKWWAEFLGYPDVSAMKAWNGLADLKSATSIDLLPAWRGVFVVGEVGDCTFQGQAYTFCLEMAGKEYRVTGEPHVPLDSEEISVGDRMRVFGRQERQDGVVAASLIECQNPWWAWWQPAWKTVYQNPNWPDPAWIYSIADDNPNSPVKFRDYPDLTHEDKILMRGTWLEGKARQNMSIDLQHVYRLDKGRYTLIYGDFSPRPKPTETLIP